VAGSRAITFGPFRLDLEQGRLTRADSPIELRRKAWEVLCHLAARPGVLVTNAELLEAVWPGVAVTPQTVTNVVLELRAALDDSAGAPRWIQTVHGRGLVFLPWGAEGTRAGAAPAGQVSTIIGRTRERQRLRELWSQARAGTARVVFVTGEAGIGKTTLVDDLVAETAAAVCCGRGAAMEQHGRPEAYLPVLSAIEAFATGMRRREVAALLRRHAPTWLVQLPGIMRADERARLEPSLVAATSARRLREGLALMRALAERFPVLLVLEDLHWADPASLDLIAALARGGGNAPLLVVGTFRAVDATISQHPVTALARELGREQRAVAIPLAPFDHATVAAYLEARLGMGGVPAALAARLEEQSAGHPLFLRALVDELLVRGAFERTAEGWRATTRVEDLLGELPESLRAFVETELERLPAELRRVVEVASVAGTEALVPELAAAMSLSTAETEDACERLASVGRLLRRASETRWHDGTDVGRYAFPHVSYRRIVHDGIRAEARQEIHRRLALGLEVAWGAHAAEAAGRLAAHFEHGGMAARALEYLEHAAATAESRFAYAEAAAYAETALARLDARAGPDGDRSLRAALLGMRLGELLVLAHGYSKPEVERVYARALAVFEAEGMAIGIFGAEMGLAVVDLTRARYQEARRRAAHLDVLARAHDPALLPIARCWAGCASSALGELTRARAELEDGMGVEAIPGLPRNFDVSRMLRSQLALVLTLLGDLDHAAMHADEARARSRRHGATSELAHALLLAAERAVFVRDPAGTATTEEAIALAETNGLVSYLALLRVYDAALRTEWPPERRAQVMRLAVAERAQLGDRWHTSLLLALLAEAELAGGDAERAGRSVAEALAYVASTGERYHEAELHRLRAECLLAERGADDAEAARWLVRAIEIARGQQARLWELRAATRLAELASAPPSATLAIETLASTLMPFETGIDVPDVRHARATLARLQSGGC
jgi:predicted ATPase